MPWFFIFECVLPVLCPAPQLGRLIVLAYVNILVSQSIDVQHRLKPTALYCEVLEDPCKTPQQCTDSTTWSKDRSKTPQCATRQP